jgi:hypothetical protein
MIGPLPLPAMIWQRGIRTRLLLLHIPGYTAIRCARTHVEAFWPGLGGNIHMAFDNLALVLGWADLLLYFSQPGLDAVQLLN